MLQQLFVRVYSRYTCSSHAGDLEAFGDWLLDQRYTLRYAQRLVFKVKRALEASPQPSADTWSTEQLDQAFAFRGRRIWRRKAYREARSTFGDFLRSVGRLVQSPSGPHGSLILAYRHYLSDVRGLAPSTVTQT
jgi:hypothetical protein